MALETFLLQLVGPVVSKPRLYSFLASLFVIIYGLMTSGETRLVRLEPVWFLAQDVVLGIE